MPALGYYQRPYCVQVFNSQLFYLVFTRILKDQQMLQRYQRALSKHLETLQNCLMCYKKSFELQNNQQIILNDPIE